MAVREGLLALLDGAPSHGYQLKTGFEAATGGVWSLNVGQVYTTLERLERDGFVTGKWVVMEERPQRRRYYSITVRGRRELARRREDWRGFSRAVEMVLEARYAHV